MPLDKSKGIFILPTFVFMKCILLILLLHISILPLLAQIELPDEDIAKGQSQNSIERTLGEDSLITLGSLKASIRLEKDSVDTNILMPALFSRESWNDFQDRIQLTGSKYFVDFTADWCAPCKVMNAQVFNDESIVEIARKSYLAKQIDIDDFDGIAIAQKYQIVSLPTILIFDCDGRILRRLEGLQYADMLLHQLLIHR